MTTHAQLDIALLKTLGLSNDAANIVYDHILELRSELEALRKENDELRRLNIEVTRTNSRFCVELEAERGKVYRVTEYAIEPFKKYLVYVANRGWTDGEYRTDSPKGWCHKWALDDALFGMENRGVTHFMEQPTKPQELRRTE